MEIILKSSIEEVSNLPIIYVSEFDLDSSVSFCNKMRKLEADPEVESIIVYINSYGGQVYAAFSMVEAVESCSKPVYTYASGIAASAGGILLSSGGKKRRIMSPRSRFHIHSVQTGCGGSTEELAEHFKSVKGLDDEVFSIIAKHSKLTPKKIKEHLKEHAGEWNLTAKEALEFGFVDKISTFKLENVSTTTLEFK